MVFWVYSDFWFLCLFYLFIREAIWGTSPPSPKKLSSINDKNKQRNQKSEKSQKTKIRIVFYPDFSLFYQKVKMILWSIHTFWYKGSSGKKENDKFEKRALSLKNSSPDSKADFSKKVLFLVWRLILSAWRIKWHI